MTMSAIPMTTLALPVPGYPMVTRMISSALFPEKGREEPVTWVVSLPHPLVPDMRVVRMFIDRGGVEVYSVSSDGKNGMRNLIPMPMIRLVEEAMPISVFVEELETAESATVDDDDEDEDEVSGLDPTPEPNTDQSNGQVVSS